MAIEYLDLKVEIDELRRENKLLKNRIPTFEEEIKISKNELELKKLRKVIE